MVYFFHSQAFMVFDMLARPLPDSTLAATVDLHIGSGIFKTIQALWCADEKRRPGAGKHQ
jgi:hypothetical protein